MRCNVKITDAYLSIRYYSCSKLLRNYEQLIAAG